MTTLALYQTATAVTAGITASFLGVGGTAPYAYSVRPGGAGGSVDAASGIYTAPLALPTNPAQALDTVVVTDSLGATASTTILVGTPLKLLVNLFQTELGLAASRVYLWNQKIIQPTDAGLYVALSVPLCKVVANTKRFNPATGDTDAFVTMRATVDIDVISRDSEARDRKEEILLALASDYAERQMVANSFSLSRLSTDFRDLSQADGAAIPYRFRISVQMLYAVSKSKPADYFSDFLSPSVITNDGATAAGTVIDGGDTASSSPLIDGGSA